MKTFSLKSIYYTLIIALAFASSFSCQSEGNTIKNTEDLFLNSFVPQMAINVYASRSVPVEVSIAEAERAKILSSASAKGVKAYNSKKYTDAITHFNTYLNASTKKDTEIIFYLSVSYLAEKQLDKAEIGFKEILKKGSKARKLDAEWYLVLTLIRKNNIPQAQEILNKIVKKKKHSYKEKAATLLQHLESL